MNCRIIARLTALFLLWPAGAGLHAQDGAMSLHDDYYLGFSQGVYYGLLMAGVDYNVAWCMKGELDYEGEKMGSGGEFQERMDALLEKCRAEHTPEE